MSRERKYQDHDIREILDLDVGSAMALPKWAREQERRMEPISRHAASLLALPASTDD